MQKDFLKDIFRQYDIRGKYPEEVNEEVAYLLGKATVSFIRKRKKIKKIDILVGQDNRKSSPFLFEALAGGILAGGGNVVSIGICTSPMFYFASGHYKIDDGGIMITASHLPKEYNGFKLVRDIPSSIDIDSGLKQIKRIMEKEPFGIGAKKGRLVKKNVLREYVKAITANFDFRKILPLKVIIDTGNASAGIIIPAAFKKTKIKLFHLFPKLDSAFPGRPLDCTKEKNLRRLKSEVIKKRADLGVAFDGDGDRVVFVDEKGRLISSTMITAFVSSLLLKTNPGEKILYTVNQGRIIPETVESLGGKAVIWKVGHSNIKDKMKENNILFGGETSAHFYYRGRFFAESPFLVLFKILENISESGKSLSELIKPFQKYYNSGEINLKIKNKKMALVSLEKEFKEGDILKMDGLRVDFPNWWFNARFSHTEPLLRLVVEADNESLMKEMVGYIKSILRNR